MRKWYLGILIAVLVSIVVVVPVGAITGGRLDEDDHPNTGALVVSFKKGGSFLICSGTLVHPKVFLTAGHCTDFLEELIRDGVITVNNVFASFDSDDALRKGSLVPTAEILTHPDYNWGPTSDPHDLGVLVLKRPVNGIAPAILPTDGFLDQLEADGVLREGSMGAKFTVVGYGTTLEWPPPQIKDPDGARYRAESEFTSLHDAWLYMSQNQATSNGGTCFGDSGGPTFWPQADGTEILVAVTSWGDAVCVSTGNAYRVDIQSSLDFIDNVISGL